MLSLRQKCLCSVATLAVLAGFAFMPQAALAEIKVSDHAVRQAQAFCSQEKVKADFCNTEVSRLLDVIDDSPQGADLIAKADKLGVKVRVDKDAWVGYANPEQKQICLPDWKQDQVNMRALVRGMISIVMEDAGFGLSTALDEKSTYALERHKLALTQVLYIRIADEIRQKSPPPEVLVPPEPPPGTTETFEQLATRLEIKLYRPNPWLVLWNDTKGGIHGDMTEEYKDSIGAGKSPLKAMRAAYDTGFFNDDTLIAWDVNTYRQMEKENISRFGEKQLADEDIKALVGLFPATKKLFDGEAELTGVFYSRIDLKKVNKISSMVLEGERRDARKPDSIFAPRYHFTGF